MINKKPSIYIVDDDASVCRSIERLLRSMNYQVNTFTSAEDFLSLECYERPGCLILDVTMPEMNGNELLKKIRSSNGPIKNMPVLMVTAANKKEQTYQNSLGYYGNRF